MQEFVIKQNATLPYLRMELINDGRNDFHKSYLYNNSIQACRVTFSMRDKENGILKVSKSPVNIIFTDAEGCDGKYILEYKWNERDTKQTGTYEAWFDIDFNGLPKEEGVRYPSGKLIMPIEENLVVIVK